MEENITREKKIPSFFETHLLQNQKKKIRKECNKNKQLAFVTHNVISRSRGEEEDRVDLVFYPLYFPTIFFFIKIPTSLIACHFFQSSLCIFTADVLQVCMPVINFFFSSLSFC